MSYHGIYGLEGAQGQQYLPLPAQAPVYHPLAIVDPAPRSITKVIVTIIIVVVIIAAILYILSQMGGESKAVKSNPVKKMSTRDMAANLYKRLDERGGANDTTLRSLQQLGRKKT
jgi:hypothetical protein